MKITYIPEAPAAAYFNWSPRTLRFRVTGTGPYAGKERLPIAFTTIGKGYQYSEPDILKVLAKTSSNQHPKPL